MIGSIFSCQVQKCSFHPHLGARQILALALTRLARLTFVFKEKYLISFFYYYLNHDLFFLVGLNYKRYF